MPKFGQTLIKWVLHPSDSDDWKDVKENMKNILVKNQVRAANIICLIF